MCGIVGIFNLNGTAQPPQTLALAREMLDTIAHRGPDGRGTQQGGGWTLGHVRLSIIDLSDSGHQPMTNEDGSLWLTYNGEIYNHVELRADLEARGHRFRSKTDSEIILHAYEEWGVDCVQRFVGMWAFGLVDTRKKRLWLSRDRLGVKPLYYHATGERIVFASEIKAILHYLRRMGETIDADPVAIETYLNTGLVDGLEGCFVKGISRFPAAFNSVIENGSVSTRSYWELPGIDPAATGPEQDGGEVAERVRETLSDAVRLHLRSDVPLGVCLSGGLDSSSTVALASKHGAPPSTFTAYFDEGPEYDERGFADQVNQAFGSESHQARIDGDDLFTRLEKLLWHLDEPTLAMGVIPQWHVMELASRSVKVVLDGQGGDELFAGYDFYLPTYLGGLFARGQLGALRDEVRGMRSEFGLDYGLDRLGQGIAMSEKMSPDTTDHLDTFLREEVTRSRLPALLRYEDRLSMAFSIESRVPFLDHRLVELAFSIPSSFKSHHGWSKFILREAMSDILPETITWRKDKKGFPTPFKMWAAGSQGKAIADLLLAGGSTVAHMVGQSALKSILDRHMREEADESWLIWRLLSLEIWARSLASQTASVDPMPELRSGLKVLPDAEPTLALSPDSLRPALQGPDAVCAETAPLEALVAAGDYAAALPALAARVQQCPTDWRAWGLLGDALQDTGQPRDAQIAWRESLGHNPNQPERKARLVPYLLLEGEAVHALPSDRAKPRVFYGPREIAGNFERDARALRAIGMDVKVVSTWKHDLYTADAEYAICGRGEEHQSNAMKFAEDMADRFDIFHFQYGRSLAPNCADVPMLKARGKKIVMTFVGCDVYSRDVGMNQGLAYTHCESCSIEPCTSAQKQPLIDFWNANADVLITGPSNGPLLGVPYSSVPLSMDLEVWKPSEPDPDKRPKGDRLLVCHCPSSREIKGTRYIVEAVERLQREGVDFEFKVLEGVPNAELRRWLNASDIVVDQILVGLCGSLSMEAMALAKPVICRAEDVFYGPFNERFGHPDVPAYSADPTTIYDALARLLADADLRRSLGQQGRAYVEEVCNATVNVRKLESIYLKLLSDGAGTTAAPKRSPDAAANREVAGRAAV